MLKELIISENITLSGLSFKESIHKNENQRKGKHRKQPVTEIELELIKNINSKFEFSNHKLIMKRSKWRLINLLWVSGLTKPKNSVSIRDELAKKILGESRSIVLGLDTSVILIYQLSFLIDELKKVVPSFRLNQRVPIIITTQATEFEIHHMLSSDVKTDLWQTENFRLPIKTYNSRGRRGAWGKFHHQTIINRYPHFIAQSEIPLLINRVLTKDSETKGKQDTFSNPSPSSPYFDISIAQQIINISKLTNLEIIFATTDSDLQGILKQSGVHSIYLEQPNNVKIDNLSLSQREVARLIVTMLYLYDTVKISTNSESPPIELIQVKNTRGKGSTLYYKQNDMSDEYWELSVDDELF